MWMYRIGNWATVKIHQSLFYRWWNNGGIQTTVVHWLHLPIPSCLIIFFGCSSCFFFFFPSFSLGVPLFFSSAVCMSPSSVKLCQNTSLATLYCTVRYTSNHPLICLYLTATLYFLFPKSKQLNWRLFLATFLYSSYYFSSCSSDFE